MCSFASFALRWCITLFLVGLVACSGSGGSGSQSGVQNAPAAPAAAMASTGTNQITIAWSEVNNASAYNLYWSSTAGVTITNPMMTRDMRSNVQSSSEKPSNLACQSTLLGNAPQNHACVLWAMDNES